MHHLLELFHSEHDEDLLDVDIHVLQDWLVVAPPLKLYTVSTVFFIKIEEQILQSQMASHTFLFLSQPRPLWNWIMEKRDMPKEFGLFYVHFLTIWLYIQLDRFIIVQVTLLTLYNQVPSNFMLVIKRLHLNLLNIVTVLSHRIALGDHHTRLTTILTIFNSKLSWSILTDTRILLSQLSADFQNKISINLFIIVLVISLSPD